MKSRIFTAVLFLVASTLASLGAVQWHKTVEEAVSLAKAKNLPILVEFTGSDWCPPCKAIAREVFESQKFADFAEDKVVLVKLDFPKKTPVPDSVKAYNASQAQKFKLESFPTMVLLNSDGTEVSRTKGYGGAQRFYDWLEGEVKKASTKSK